MPWLSGLESAQHGTGTGISQKEVCSTHAWSWDQARKKVHSTHAWYWNPAEICSDLWYFRCVSVFSLGFPFSFSGCCCVPGPSCWLLSSKPGGFSLSMITEPLTGSVPHSCAIHLSSHRHSLVAVPCLSVILLLSLYSSHGVAGQDQKKTLLSHFVSNLKHNHAYACPIVLWSQNLRLFF